MSKWEKHPLDEVKGVLQLLRVLQIQSPKSKHMACGRFPRSSKAILPSKMIAVAEDSRCSESGEACLSSGMMVRIPMGVWDMSGFSQTKITYQMSPWISMAENTRQPLKVQCNTSSSLQLLGNVLATTTGGWWVNFQCSTGMWNSYSSPLISLLWQYSERISQEHQR